MGSCLFLCLWKFLSCVTVSPPSRLRSSTTRGARFSARVEWQFIGNQTRGETYNIQSLLSAVNRILEK